MTTMRHDRNCCDGFAIYSCFKQAHLKPTQCMCQLYLFKKVFVFNFLTALGLRCGPRASLVVAHRFSCLTAGGILNLPNEESKPRSLHRKLSVLTSVPPGNYPDGGFSFNMGKRISSLRLWQIRPTS